jgi:polyhydroxybutyrate depolymerase
VWGDDYHLKLQSGGHDRSAQLHLPPATQGQQTVPLVVVLHTMAEDPGLMASLTGFDALADQEGFAVLYPRGLELANLEKWMPLGVGYTWNAGQCCPKACADKVDDVTFIKDVVAYTKAQTSTVTDGQFNIDARRIYLSGGSNGGFMTNRIGCQAPELFAALAPVAGPIANGKGTIVWGTDPYECPALSKPLPTIYFHGTLDPLVLYNGGGPLNFPSVAEYVDLMKDRNGIEGDDGMVTYEKGDVLCTAYGNQAQNFTFCKHGNQHCWPGHTSQGPCTKNIDATSAIWEFFKNYQLDSDSELRSSVHLSV